MYIGSANTLGNAELIEELDLIIVQSVKEANFSMRGVTKKTNKEIDKLKAELLRRLEGAETK